MAGKINWTKDRKRRLMRDHGTEPAAAPLGSGVGRTPVKRRAASPGEPRPHRALGYGPNHVEVTCECGYSEVWHAPTPTHPVGELRCPDCRRLGMMSFETR